MRDQLLKINFEQVEIYSYRNYMLVTLYMVLHKSCASKTLCKLCILCILCIASLSRALSLKTLCKVCILCIASCSRALYLKTLCKVCILCILCSKAPKTRPKHLEQTCSESDFKQLKTRKALRSLITRWFTHPMQTPHAVPCSICVTSVWCAN
jgi:hypothetical protein